MRRGLAARGCGRGRRGGGRSPRCPRSRPVGQSDRRREPPRRHRSLGHPVAGIPDHRRPAAQHQGLRDDDQRPAGRHASAFASPPRAASRTRSTCIGWGTTRGNGGRHIAHLGPFAGAPQPACYTVRATGMVTCPWHTSVRLHVPRVVDVRRLLRGADDAEVALSSPRSCSRSATAVRPALVYMSSVNTYQAYNNFPYDPPPESAGTTARTRSPGAACTTSTARSPPGTRTAGRPSR